MLAPEEVQAKDNRRGKEYIYIYIYVCICIYFFSTIITIIIISIVFLLPLYCYVNIISIILSVLYKGIRIVKKKERR